MATVPGETTGEGFAGAERTFTIEGMMRGRPRPAGGHPALHGAAERVRALERQRDQGSVRKVGERWTVGRWLTHWVTTTRGHSRLTKVRRTVRTGTDVRARQFE